MIRNVLLLLLFCVIVTGCSRLERPAGMPELYPCSITVTFGGEAVEDVRVQLLPEDRDNKWGAGGRTDSKGVAVMSAAVGFNGVPEGRYVISFTKTEEREGMTVAEMTPRSLIPLKYSSTNSTEVVEIKPERNAFSFALDAGEEIVPVRRGARDQPGSRPR